MAKGFYVSKIVAFVGIFFAIAAVATIIALAVVYANEKSNNKAENGGGTTTTTTTSGPTKTTSVKPTTPTPNEIWDQYRLQGFLSPQHYDIDLRPVLVKNTEGLYVFHGESTAHFKCIKATDYVIIHSKKLNHTSKVVRDENNVAIEIIEDFSVEKTNYLVLRLKEPLVVLKNYKLHTTFKGELADDLAGFYRSEYVEDGVTKIIATTQMQAPDARKAFPCFDEPALKATFSIIIRHKPENVALSNMNITDVYTEMWNDEAWNVTTFEKTPKMSTYLVAFIVSEFDYVSNDTGLFPFARYASESRMWKRSSGAGTPERSVRPHRNTCNRTLRSGVLAPELRFHMPDSDGQQISVTVHNKATVEI
ncbi:unnamed protein product [Ranitomeya imitator]|uniref:Aminopeptidase N-like N-terminal domain-containing protein n=1 Tax=Ranitomeya imitator TaxID=111125 RepID=A0ABN9LW32_9NEOB|nr:unnamed protein product [Ranitomeya imitator]